MIKMNLYISIIIIFILTVSLTLIITSCPISLATDQRTSAPQIDRAYLIDEDHDGIIDTARIVFNRRIQDSTVVYTKWVFWRSDVTSDKYTATGFDTETTANDNTLKFYYGPAVPIGRDLSIDTSSRGASLEFLDGNSIKDFTGIKYTEYLPEIRNIKELDDAAPIIKEALYYDASADPNKGTIGVSKDDLIDIVFSEKIKDSLIEVSDDIILSILSDSFGGTDKVYSFYNGSLRIKLGTSPSLDINGSSRVNLTDQPLNISLQDYSGHKAVRRIESGYPDGAVDITETTIPTIASAVLRDRNNNGRIDAVDLTFSEAMNDSTFVANQWKFGSKKGTGTGIDTSGDVNDNFMTILYSTDDLTPDTTTYTATIDFIGTSCEDLYYNDLPPVENIPRTDGAGPAVMSADATDDSSYPPAPGIDNNDKVIIKFSERTNRPAINSTNIGTVLQLNNGHIWGTINRASWSVINEKGINLDVLTVYLSINTVLPTIAGGDTITLDGKTITDGKNSVIATYTINGNFGL